MLLPINANKNVISLSTLEALSESLNWMINTSLELMTKPVVLNSNPTTTHQNPEKLHQFEYRNSNVSRISSTNLIHSRREIDELASQKTNYLRKKIPKPSMMVCRKFARIAALEIFKPSWGKGADRCIILKEKERGFFATDLGLYDLVMLENPLKLTMVFRNLTKMYDIS